MCFCAYIFQTNYLTNEQMNDSTILHVDMLIDMG